MRRSATSATTIPASSPASLDPPEDKAVADLPRSARGIVVGTDTLDAGGRRCGRVDAVVGVDLAPGLWVPAYEPEFTPTPVASPDDAGVGSYEVHPVAGPRYTSGLTWASAPVI